MLISAELKPAGKTGGTIQERRKFKRVKVTALAQWKRFTANPEHTPSFPAIVKNVSPGGFCFSSYAQLKTGDKVRVEMTLPSKVILSFRAEIVWTSKPEPGNLPNRLRFDMGAKIVDISEKDQEELNRFTFLHFFSDGTPTDVL